MIDGIPNRPLKFLPKGHYWKGPIHKPFLMCFLLPDTSKSTLLLPLLGGNQHLAATKQYNHPIIWVNYNEFTTREPWKSWFMLGKSSPNGCKIQVSELLYFTQNHPTIRQGQMFLLNYLLDRMIRWLTSSASQLHKKNWGPSIVEVAWRHAVCSHGFRNHDIYETVGNVSFLQ